MTQIRPRFRLALAILAGATLTGLVATMPAVGQVSPPAPVSSVEILSPASLVGRGEAVIVPVQVTCTSEFGGSRFVGVEVGQRHGNRIASGFGGAQVACDGTTQVVDVLVRSDNSPFRRGSALVTASLFVCDEFGCREVSDTEEVVVQR